MKTTFRFLILVLLVTLPLATAYGQESKYSTGAMNDDDDDIIQDAVNAYKLGHYDNCVRLLRLADRKNSPVADYYFGLCYHFGNGVDQNYESALRYFQEASSGRYFHGSYMAGLYYENGYVGEPDLKEAINQYSYGAEKGQHGESMRALGNLYMDGKGVEQDYRKAFDWFTKAVADSENPRAQYSLGLIHEQGLLGSANKAKALSHYDKALAGGDKRAQAAKGFMIEQDNPAEAAILLAEAAKSGDLKSVVWMGNAYRAGKGVDKDFGVALEYYGAAAQAGSDEAFVALGDMFKAGEGIEADPASAAQWYNEAVKMNNAEACFKLGVMFVEGAGVQKDDATANKLIDFAASKGYKPAVDYRK